MVFERKITRYGYIAAARRARRRCRVMAWVLALLALAAEIFVLAAVLMGR
jgi:hypothetical protein